MGELIGDVTDTKNGLMTSLLYNNYSRPYNTFSSNRKLWEIAINKYEDPYLITINGRDSINLSYLVHYVIGLKTCKKYPIFNDTPDTLKLYKDNNSNIYLELNGPYASANVMLSSRSVALQQEDVTDTIQTSSLQLIE